MDIEYLWIDDRCHIYMWNDINNHNIKSGTISTHAIDDPVYYSKALYDELFFYKYKPKPGDIVLDIGAGPGEHISYLSNLVGSDGMVIAIEADPILHEYSKILVSKLNLKNVKLINAAVSSDSNSQLALSQVDNWIQNSVISDPSNSNDYILVNTITLDEIFKNYELKHIDYIKMNIEGAEVDALKGINDNFYNVKNWCISTHDFCGIPSKDFVEDFFQNKKMDYVFHPEVTDQPWVGGYLFSSIV
jgi:FkbM family methyltransferase